MISRSGLALVLAAVAYAGTSGGTAVTAAPSRAVRMLDTLNVQLAGRGASYRVAKMEYVTSPGSGQYGATVFAKDVGNKQLDFHFAPDLLAYAADAPGLVSYAVDAQDGAATGGLTGAQTEGAITRAMNTWGSRACSQLRVGKVAPPPAHSDLGVVQFLLGFGGADFWVADITHAGWVPGLFFDVISGDDKGHEYIIGVTFTFIWVDANGNPIDTNRDKKLDAAFREIYYNNDFSWTNNVVDFTSPDIDVETIALHEGGHGFSQAHFGQIFNDGYGTKTPGFQPSHLHFAPRAVMNAIYWDTQRALLGTDTGGHCSIWGNWGQ